MYRVLFLILFVTLFFYGVSGVLSPLKNISQTQVSQDFESYLSGALARNTPIQETYNVTFYRRDFTEIPVRESYFIGGNTLDFQNESSQNSYGYTVSTGSEKINTPKTNFEELISLSFGSSQCAGLIYDPCIVLGDPIKMDGGLDFGVYRGALYN